MPQDSILWRRAPWLQPLMPMSPSTHPRRSSRRPSKCSTTSQKNPWRRSPPLAGRPGSSKVGRNILTHRPPKVSRTNCSWASNNKWENFPSTEGQGLSCLRGIGSILFVTICNTFEFDSIYLLILCTSYVFNALVTQTIKCSVHVFNSRLNAKSKWILLEKSGDK